MSVDRPLLFSLSQRLKYERTSSQKSITQRIRLPWNSPRIKSLLWIGTLFVSILLDSIGSIDWKWIWKLKNWLMWPIFLALDTINPISGQVSQGMWDLSDQSPETRTGKTILLEDSVPTNSKVRSSPSPSLDGSPVSRRGQVIWYYRSPNNEVPEGYIELEEGMGSERKAFFTAKDVLFGHGAKFNYPWFEAGDYVYCYIKNNRAYEVRYFSSPAFFNRRLRHVGNQENGSSLYLDLGDAIANGAGGATAGDDDDDLPLYKRHLNLYLVRRDRNVKEKE